MRGLLCEGMAWGRVGQSGCMCMESGRCMFAMRTEWDGMGWMSLRMLFVLV